MGSELGDEPRDPEEELDTSHLTPALVPPTVVLLLAEPAACLAADPAPVGHLLVDPPASFSGSVPAAPDEYPDLFAGSRPYVQYRLPGNRVPSRIRLEQSVVDELVEHWYRTEPGWRRFDQVTAAVSQGGLINESSASQLDPSGADPDAQSLSQPLRQRGQEARVFERMSAAAQRKLAHGIAWHLVQAEDWARSEVLSRLSGSVQTIAGELARFAPNGPYGRFAGAEAVRDLTPAAFSSLLHDTPYVPERSSRAFVDLLTTLRNLDDCRRWAKGVAARGGASVAADVLAAGQGMIDVLAGGTPKPPDSVGDQALQLGRRLVAEIQWFADQISGRGQTTAPIRPQRSAAAIGAAVQLAAADNARAAQLFLLVQAATVQAFPLAHRMDLAALTGRDADAAAAAMTSAATDVAKSAATLQAELGSSLTSLKHVGDRRADVGTGADKKVRDAFSYPPAVFAALRRAGMIEGSIGYAAACEAMRERGTLSTLVEAWRTMNDVAGLAALLARESGKKLPAAAVSAAALSIVEAIQQTWWFSETKTAALAVLEPSLRLIEQEPSLVSVFSAWGAAAVDVFFALIEIAPWILAAAA
jgi:hypothetical protein